MKIGLTIAGLKETRANLREYAKAAGKTMDDSAEEGAEKLKKYIQENIETGPKTGRIYRRYRPFRIHQASDPGQSPANDLGNLAASFVAQKVKINQYSYRGLVSSTSPYALRLEKGGGNIRPRPYILPAIERLRKEMGDIVEQKWRMYK